MNANNRNMTMVKTVNLKSVIDRLMVSESKSIAVTSLCKEYLSKLNEGMHEEEICESFVVELSKVAQSAEAKKVLDEINESVKENETNISLAKSIYALSKGSLMYAAPIIESAVVNYMLNKNATTREDTKISLSLFESNPDVKSIIETMNFESYQERTGKPLVNVILKEEYNESAPRTYTEDEVNAIIENRVAVAKEEAVAPKEKRTLESMENRINLHGVITNILKENARNEKLRVFCEKYIKAMNEGKSDEVLYESFISGISNWNYLNAVDTEVSALNSRIKQYKQEIDIKKILETMKQTGSYYIVPLIEDVVVDFAENKNMATKALMLQRLESFEYDPFVRDIMNIALRDQSIGDNVYLGESLEMCNNYAKSEKIFSPVYYIKENESVFNVRGTYYKRNGDNISKLSKNDVSNLSESFRNLCSLINSSSVVISDELNTITLYSGNSNKAVISESSVVINGNRVKSGALDTLASKARIMNEKEDAAFYAAVKVLNENFDNIANIDFVKRVSAKDNSGLCVDVFKINENICVNTINAALGKSIFYKNVNPIQCRNYINEHMGINVAPMFEDVLPDQESAKKNIEEKKKEYENYIESLEEKKKTLEKMKEESSDTDDIDNAIDMIDKEIEDTKNDYKKYQKDADDFLNGNDKDKEEDDDLKDQKDTDDEDGKDTKDGDEETEDSDKKQKESPEDMQQPITDIQGDEDEFDGDDLGGDVVSDENPDEYKDVPEFDPYFDVAIDSTSVSSDSFGDESGDDESVSTNFTVSEDTDGYKVVRVSYNKNVKTGKTSNKGEVIVIIPSVDANGDVHDDMRKITFMLDGDRTPIINNEYMPLAMYNAIVDAIESCPDTENVSIDGESNDNEGDNPDDNGGGIVPADDSEFSEKDIVDAIMPVDNDDADNTVDSSDGGTETDSTPVEPVERETPAETQEEDKKSKYPITLGVYPEEIEPMKMPDFEKHLDKMKITHTESEAKDGEVCVKIGNKAQKEAFKKFIKEWFNYTNEELKSFVPEVCEDDEMECVKESECPFRVIIPATRTYSKILGIKEDRRADSFTVIAESKKEAQRIYNKLYEHSYRRGGNVETDVQDILEYYAPLYKDNAEKYLKYDLVIPYNGFVESKLISKGFNVKRVNENMSVQILRSDYEKTKKLLESIYKSGTPKSVKKFINFVNESLIITIKDESTGKSVEINADTVTSSDKSNNEETADFESSFRDSTFDPEKSMLFKDDEESADESDEKKDDEKEESKKTKGGKEKKTDEGDGLDVESNESADEENDKEDNDKEEKPKKKVTFKIKKSSKKETSNESVRTKRGNALNEEAGVAKTTVLDYVLVPDGRKGQVICQLADGTLIVNVQGHTLPFESRQLKPVTKRPDTLDFPMKFDPLTLKGLVESYVQCGMFLNNVQVTPNDCKVKLMEYNSANENEEINIIIEGEATKALKKFVKITENLNDVLDLANYAEGKMTLNVEGVLTESDVLINISDYTKYKNVNEDVYPVRTLVFDENGETHMKYVNGTQLHLNESSDIYVPEYIHDLNRAMLLSK